MFFLTFFFPAFYLTGFGYTAGKREGCLRQADTVFFYISFERVLKPCFFSAIFALAGVPDKPNLYTCLNCLNFHVLAPC